MRSASLCVSALVLFTGIACSFGSHDDDEKVGSSSHAVSRQAKKCSFPLPQAPNWGGNPASWFTWAPDSTAICEYQVTDTRNVDDASVLEPTLSTSKEWDHCGDDVGVAGQKITISAKHKDSI